MRSASAVIVGGGVLGASTAYHLAAAGWKDLLVLDRGPCPGAGSTGRATGGFRSQFDTPIQVRLSRLSLEKLLRFPEEIGVDPGYVPAGYLWVARDEIGMAALRAALGVQRGEGLVEAREVDASEILDINPHLAPEGILGGCFCSSDGFIRPLDILKGYLSAAERLGVRIEWGAEVTGLELGPGGIVRVAYTRSGAIACQAVVNAAGAWASPLAELAEVALPVTPLKRQVGVTQPFESLPAGMPMTVFPSTGFHLRVRDGRVLLLRGDRVAAMDPWSLTLDDSWLDSVFSEARQRVPVLAETAIDRAACWAGLYEMSPDRHPIVGAAPGCENLFLINGASGHGVMHAPALGQILSEIMSGGRAETLDVTALRPSRFDEGDPNPCSAML